MYREKRGKGWKLRRKEGKLQKGRWKIENGSKKSVKRGEDLFFFFFFCFSLLKMKESCFGSTKMGFFYRERTFHAGKKWLCPLRKICLLRPCKTRFHCSIWVMLQSKLFSFKLFSVYLANLISMSFIERQWSPRHGIDSSRRRILYPQLPQALQLRDWVVRQTQVLLPNPHGLDE